MYLDYYKLREYPFSLACDPRFLYFSNGHREAMAGLLYCLRERKGAALLVGEPGTGKTTLLAAVLEMLPGGARAQVLDTPLHATPAELLQAVLRGFGLPAEGAGLSDLLARLQAFLLDRHAHGQCALLVIDEAQDLNPVVLEQVRLLTNLEAQGAKLLQVILSGQPELTGHLRTLHGRALEQRVAVRCELQPLNPAETAAYVAARLEHAGAAGASLFEAAALARLHEVSKGVPRVINIAADHALLAGFAAGTPCVTVALLERAARQLDLIPAAAATAPIAAPPAAPAAAAPPERRPAALQRFATGWARWAGLTE